MSGSRFAVTRSWCVAKVRVALDTSGRAFIFSSILDAQWAQPRFSIRYVLVVNAPGILKRGTTSTCDSIEAQISWIRGKRDAWSLADRRSWFVAKVIVAYSTPGSSLILASILAAQFAQPRFFRI